MKSAFTVHHLFGAFTTALCDVHDGDAARAVQNLVGTRRQFRATIHFPRLQFARVRTETVWGSANLAAAVDAPPRSAAKRTHLRAARNAAAKLRSEGKPYATALGDLLAGAVHVEAREDEPASAALDAAATGFDACGMVLLAAVARLRRGQLVGGDAGQETAARALTTMTDLGARDADALSRIFAAAR